MFVLEADRLPFVPVERGDRLRQHVRRLAVRRARHRAGVALERRAIERLRLAERSDEHTSELQSLMRFPSPVFCLQTQSHTDYEKSSDTPFSSPTEYAASHSTNN